MHKPFSPIPSWLNPAKGVDSGTPLSLVVKEPQEFQALFFQALYGLGLTDRQTTEITSLFLLILNNRADHLARIQISEEGVKRWKVLHPGKDPSWYRDGFRFFWVFETLEEFLGTWIILNLPKGHGFWLGGDSHWVLPFLLGPEQEDTFRKITEKVRILLAQSVLGVPQTGVWDKASALACRAFQQGHTQTILPWKVGLLDGFTYRALAELWRARKGLSVARSSLLAS